MHSCSETTPVPDEAVRQLALQSCRDVYGPGEECDMPCDLCWQEALALLETWR